MLYRRSLRVTSGTFFSERTLRASYVKFANFSPHHCNTFFCGEPYIAFLDACERELRVNRIRSFNQPAATACRRAMPSTM